MRIFVKHIILIFLVIGSVSLSFNSNNTSAVNNFIIDNELEESIFESIEFSPDLKIKILDIDGGGFVFTIPSTLSLSSFDSIVSVFTSFRDITKKYRLFILYCCLKIDC